uniref:G_PROTEIN_RECEP_F1_2 domain-containing protein n=1 Tax=Heterorhabditis bacteriophora TaxID=37862 RepID=A0A1I7WEZ7_HETBA
MGISIYFAMRKFISETNCLMKKFHDSLMDSFAQITRECAQRLEQDEYEEVSLSTILTIAPIFSIISFVVCIVLIVFLIFALIKRRIPSRKYSIVLSRTVADLFTSAFVGAAFLLANLHSASYAILALFLYVATFGFVLISFSHLFVIILRQMSVTRPYGFQSTCTMRRICTAVAVTWIMSILYAVSFAPLTTVVLDPSRSKDVCSYGSCQKPMLVIVISFIIAFLIIVFCSYCAVTYKMKKIAHSERMHNEPEVTKKKMLKFLVFGGHIALYILISILILIGAGIILHNVWLYNQIRNLMKEKCDVVEYINTLIRLETIAGGAIILWLVRIVFDVFIVFITEYRRLIPCLTTDNLEPLRNSPHSSID